MPGPMCYCLLWLSLSSLLGARTVQVDDTHISVRYTPSRILPSDACAFQPNNFECAGNWWTEAGVSNFINTVHETFGPDSSLEFEFQGSSVSLYGITLDAGARASVSVDDLEPLVVSFTGSKQSRKRVFHRDGLDPRLHHILRVAYDPTSYGGSDKRRWMGIDYLEYTVADAAVLTTSSTTSAPSSTTSAVANGQHDSDRVRKLNFVGIIVGSVGAGLLVLVVLPSIYVWWRRSSIPASLQLSSNPTMHHSAQSVALMSRPA